MHLLSFIEIRDSLSKQIQFSSPLHDVLFAPSICVLAISLRTDGTHPSVSPPAMSIMLCQEAGR